VPWCPACDRFLSPATVRADGTCPGCGRAVDPGRVGTGVRGGDDALPPVPWHLKLLGAAVAVYLGYRAWQGLEWVWHQL
jgi:hypothetical protein